MNKKLKVITIPLFIILLFAFIYVRYVDNINNESKFEKAKIVEVIDGDTIVVNNSAGINQSIRLIGINSPEKDGPYTEEENFGVESSEFLKSLLEEYEYVFLQKDISNTDKYGRLLRYVWLNEPEKVNIKEITENLVNAIIVKNGYAYAKEYPPDTLYSNYLKTFMEEAKEKNIGMYVKEEHSNTQTNNDSSSNSNIENTKHIDINNEYFKPTETLYDSKIYHIEIYKSQRTLKLYADNKHIASFKIALSSSPVGDKHLEGDKKTPEGEYYICTINTQSRFTLFFGLSYPNLKDARYGLENNIITKEEFKDIENSIMNKTRPNWYSPLGGEVGIHGGGTNSDWTLGCIALSDEDILILKDYVGYNTKILIYP